jgi:hypothetical protein
VFVALAIASTTLDCEMTSSPGLLTRMMMITLICWMPVAAATAPAFCVVFADCAVSCAPADPPEAGAGGGAVEAPSWVALGVSWDAVWDVAAVLAAAASEVTVFAWDAVADPAPLSELVPIAFVCDKSPATAAPFAPWVVDASWAAVTAAAGAAGVVASTTAPATGEGGAESSAAAFLAVARNVAISRERTSATRNARVAPPPKGRWRNVVEEVFALKKGRADRK